MAVVATCNKCGAKYPFPKKFLGRQAKCKRCGNLFKVQEGVQIAAAVSVADSTPPLDLSDLQELEGRPTSDAPAPHPAAVQRAPALETEVLSGTAVYWLERGLVFIGYGLPLLGAFFVAVGRPHPALAIAVVLLATLLLIFLVAPLGVWGLRIASRMTEFPMAGSARLKVMAAFAAVPLCTVFFLRLFRPSLSRPHDWDAFFALLRPGLLGLLIGLPVAIALLWALLHVHARQAFIAWVFSGASYVLGSVLCVGILAGVIFSVGEIRNALGRPSLAISEPGQATRPSPPLVLGPPDSAPPTTLTAVSPGHPTPVVPAPPPGPAPEDLLFTANVDAANVDPSTDTDSSTSHGGAPLSRTASALVTGVDRLTVMGQFDSWLAPVRLSDAVAIIYADGDGKRPDVVERWALNPPRKIAPLIVHSDPVESGYILSNDGAWLVHLLGGPREKAEAWSFDHPDQPQRQIDLDERYGQPLLLGFITSDNFLVHRVRGSTQGVQIFNAGNGQPVRQLDLPSHGDPMRTLAISRDGQSLAVCTKNSDATAAEVQVIDLTGPSGPHHLPLDGIDPKTLDSPYGLAFSPDGDRVAAFFAHDNAATLVVWRLIDNRPAFQRTYPAGLLSEADWERNSAGLEYLPNSETLIAGGRIVLDAKDGTELGTLQISDVRACRALESDKLLIQYGPKGAQSGLALVNLDATAIAQKERDARAKD